MGTKIALTSKSANASDVRRKFEAICSDLVRQTTMIVREFPNVPTRKRIISTKDAKRTPTAEPSCVELSSFPVAFI